MSTDVGRFAYLALDLEGTLISNAVSQIPRPGLRRFLEHCDVMFDEVVVFTTVSEARFRAIAERLAEEDHAPRVFRRTRHVHCTDGQKDLGRIPWCGNPAMTLLVDDYADYVVPGQEANWVQAPLFASPYTENDGALAALIPQLARRVLGWRWGMPAISAHPAGLPGVPEHWSPESLTIDQTAALLTLLAGASKVTADRRDAFALLSDAPAAFGGRTALDWVSAERSEVALGYLGVMQAGALG